MEARHFNRHRMIVWVGLWVAVSILGASVVPSQGLQPATASGSILYRLNAGGPTIAAIDNGPNWISDAGFYGGGTRVVTGRTVSGLDSSVAPEAPRAVFFTERFNPPNTPNMTYDLPVDAGTRVELRLYFMNGFRGTSEPGERVFDILVDGRVVVNDLDLSEQFGHQIGGMHVLVLESDGEINIEFDRDIQAPLINAIEVVEVEIGHPAPVAGALYRLNAGGPTIAAIDGGPDWISDAGFFGGGTQVVTGRNVRGLDESVPPEAPRSVFFTERFNPRNAPNITYRFPIPAGIRVMVRLYMMNGFAGTSQPGQRLFDVEIDGVFVMRDVDLSDEFGHQIGGMRSVTVVSDGELNIQFDRNVQAPLINAIEIIEADDTPVVEINPRRSLIETSPAALAGLDLRTILRRVAENSGFTPAPVRHYQQLIDSYSSRVVTPEAQRCTGSLNGFFIECDRREREQLNNIDVWFPIALVNRMDLAPEDGRHCGQQRIILANNAPIGNGRMFIIFEAELPNPNPSCGVQGCRPIVEFWESLSAIDNPGRRNELLQGAFLHGLPSLLDDGVEPFMAANFLGPQGGQIRTNNFNDQPWTLREFRVRHRGAGIAIHPAPVADSPNGQLWDDTSAAFVRNPQCRASILDALAGLMTDNPAQMSFVVDESCLDAESRNDGGQEYIFALSRGRLNGFRADIADRIRDLRPDSQLTPEDMAERAHFAGSCIGCHEEAIGKDLGNGVEAPFSAGFVHVNEQFDEEDCGDGTNCFEISPALANVFLPHRQAVMERFLAEPETVCRDRQVSLRTLTTRVSGSMKMKTLGGQDANVNH